MGIRKLKTLRDRVVFLQILFAQDIPSTCTHVGSRPHQWSAHSAQHCTG